MHKFHPEDRQAYNCQHADYSCIIRESEEMTGKKIVKLSEKPEQDGSTAEKIIEIIKYIETHDPKENDSK